MIYEKRIMRVTELYEIGVPKPVIQCAIKEKKNFIRKADPSKSNSPYVVDTQEFEKWWIRKNAAVRKSMYG